MIARSLVIFAILFVSVYLGAHLQQDPGYLLIVIHHWIIETTLWVAMGVLLIAGTLLYLILLAVRSLIHIPKIWHQWRITRRLHAAQAKTRQGLIEFSEGHWQSAKKHLIMALPDAETPLLNYLTAARAAQEMGDSTLRDDYLRQAQQSMPEAKIAVELTQAQLQLANQQWEQALATLKHLQDLVPHHTYVLKLLMKLYEEIKDWPQLITLLPTLKRDKVISNDALKTLQHRAYHQALLDLIKQDQTEAVHQFIESLPKELKYTPDLVASYTGYLLKHQQDKQAETILFRCLQKQMDDALISLYGQLSSTHAQLDFIESLLKKYPHSAPLNLCLGRICLSKQLWGKAHTYLDESIKLHPTPEAYAELGHLFEQLNQEPAACQMYKKGLAIECGE